VEGDSGRENRGTSARQRLLTPAEPSHAAGIADAVVIKDGAIFFLNRPDGSVPLEEGHGLGLDLHDCRFLSGYEMRIADVHPEPLAARTDEGFRATSQLTNPNISRVGAGIDRHRLGITWTHAIDAERQALRDRISIANYDTEAHEFPLTLAMRCDFSDVYVIRGLVEQQPGRRHSPRWDGDTLVFSYDGGDGRRRELAVEFSERPAFRDENSVRFDLRIEPHETHQIDVTLSTREFAPDDAMAPRAGASNEAFDRSIEDWMHGFAQVRSSSRLLAMTVNRSLQDLRALRMDLDGHRFFAAGIPWFATLFGRDSLTCALQTLAYRREIAAETLRLLANLQGKKEDSWRDEEPGKILHELRVGELARMGRIPYTPYYGTVDATPLFLIVLAEYTNWTGDLSLFEELRDEADAALRWIDDYGDHDGDGYLDYQAETGARLINQGWKDAGGSIIDADGRVADAPIALVEVQGYVYHAKQLMADLFERAGDTSRANALGHHRNPWKAQKSPSISRILRAMTAAFSCCSHITI
jgi:glycogen debranching enzyme